MLKLNSQHKGNITVGGIEISNIDFDYYYGLVSSIDKNDIFLNISIKENLSIVNNNFEEMVYICKKLDIHDEISQLKFGYDTILNSNEDKLKANTKILLNIARILLKNTKIMIFDEILSSLSKESREVVLEKLNIIKEKHTIIIIDRKEDVLQMSDNIVLLDEGEVVQEGTYEELSTNKEFKKIIEK